MSTPGGSWWDPIGITDVLDLFPSPGALVGDVFGQTLSGLTQSVASAVAYCCVKLLESIGQIQPEFGGDGFLTAYNRATTVGLLLAVLGLIVGVSIGAIRGRLDTVANTLVRYVVLVAGVGVLPGVCGLLIDLADGVTIGLTDGAEGELAKAFADLSTSIAPAVTTGDAGAPVLVGLVFGVVALLAALVLAVVMTVRDAGLYCVVFFAPLACAAAIAGATAWLRRLAETFIGLLLLKPVIFGVLSLGVTLTSSGSGDAWSALLAGCAILLAAIAAPFVVLSIVHQGSGTNAAQSATSAVAASASTVTRSAARAATIAASGPN